MTLSQLLDPHLLRTPAGNFYTAAWFGDRSAVVFGDRDSAERFSDRHPHLGLEVVSLARLQEEFVGVDTLAIGR